MEAQKSDLGTILTGCAQLLGIPLTFLNVVFPKTYKLLDTLVGNCHFKERFLLGYDRFCLCHSVLNRRRVTHIG